MVASSILGFKRKCSELEKEKEREAKKIKIENDGLSPSLEDMIKIRTKSTIYGGICPNIMSSSAVRIFIARVISKISARASKALFGRLIDDIPRMKCIGE